MGLPALAVECRPRPGAKLADHGHEATPFDRGRLVNTETGANNIVRAVKDAISLETKIPVDQLREDEPLESYGIESVMAVSIVRRLEETFGELAKTLLFEYQTLGSLLRYFEEEFGGGGDCATHISSAARAEPQAGDGRGALDLKGESAPFPPTPTAAGRFIDSHTTAGPAETFAAAEPPGGVRKESASGIMSVG